LIERRKNDFGIVIWIIDDLNYKYQIGDFFSFESI